MNKNYMELLEEMLRVYGSEATIAEVMAAERTPAGSQPFRNGEEVRWTGPADGRIRDNKLSGGIVRNTAFENGCYVRWPGSLTVATPSAMEEELCRHGNLERVYLGLVTP
jgi:hypothetical protein